MEEILTGYCRCLDQSRMVVVEDGEPDCAYFGCPHVQSCEIAKRIREICEKNMD